MATTISREAPMWAISREESYYAKHMDEDAFVPFDQLSEYKQKRQKGRWIAYAFTLDDPKRAYIYETVVTLVEQHAQNYSSYFWADLGAGNGKNTIKTANMLHENCISNTGHLIEQSGAALDEAKKLFKGNGFDNLTQFLQKDVINTGLPDQSMNAVTCVNVWHHLPNWEKLMASANEINRVIKPGGLFVIVDTRPLPEPTTILNRFMRGKIEGKIRGAVNFKSFLAQAQSEGIQISKNDPEAEGMQDFCNHDAFKAFENALTKTQFAETLKSSALAPSLQKIADLRSPHPILKLLYPPLHIAWGIKS